MFEISGLYKHISKPIESYHKLGRFTHVEKGSGFTFINNNANVLAVAHLDYVTYPWKRMVKKRNKKFFYSYRLDDRLGAYIILDVLPKMGLKYDILLTEDEEVGMSTAEQFISDKQYNWMFSFDRHGQDVVMYQFHEKKFATLLAYYGLELAYGSYSDIAYLDPLGCTGFNFGTGYYMEHTMDCFCVPKIVRTQIKKFTSFFNEQKDIYYPYVPYYYKPKHKDNTAWFDRLDDQYYDTHNVTTSSAKFISTATSFLSSGEGNLERFEDDEIDYEDKLRYSCDICGKYYKNDSVLYNTGICTFCTEEAEMDYRFHATIEEDETIVDGELIDTKDIPWYKDKRLFK